MFGVKKDLGFLMVFTTILTFFLVDSQHSVNFPLRELKKLKSLKIRQNLRGKLQLLSM